MFGAGLVGLMEMADEMTLLQRRYLMWALANSLERLLRDGAVQPVASGHRHPPRLADFIRRRAVVAPWPGRKRAWAGSKRGAAGRKSGRR
jgi:hypothetical protein